MAQPYQASTKRFHLLFIDLNIHHILTILTFIPLGLTSPLNSKMKPPAVSRTSHA